MAYGYSLNEIGHITRAEETFTAFQPYYLPIIFKNGLPALLPPLAPITPTTRIIDYSYDNLYRLTRADYSTGEYFHYSYDPRGNRLTQNTLSGTVNYSYDNANRLTQVNGQSYSWDDNGNLLDDGIRAYSYDSANRLISVTEGVTATQFGYNGDGDRISQTVGGVTTDYALDPIGLAQVLVATTGGQSEFYVPGLAQYNGSQWQYFAPDRLGSVRQLVDPTGQLLLAQSFDPFGNVLEQGGAGSSVFGYTGEQVDSTGLVYLRARYYSPEMGRFLTADTIVPDPLRSVGWNRYAYTGNNPIRYTDPSGHCFGVLAGIDTLTCVSLITAAALAFGTSAYYATNPDIAQTQAEAIGELAGGLADVLIPPPVPYEQEAFIPPPPDPCTYHPGPTLGGEFTGPLHLPGPTLEIPLPDTTLDFPLERPEVLGDNILRASGMGRSGKQERLRELADDPKIPSAIRGWIKQELNAIEQGKRSSIRVPPGMVLAHLRGFEAKKGYDYEYSDLQEIILHLLQHRHEGY